MAEEERNKIKKMEWEREGNLSCISKLASLAYPFGIQIPCWLNSDVISHQGEQEIGS